MRSILITLSLILLSVSGGCISSLSLPFQKASSSNSGAYDGVTEFYPEATPQLAQDAAKRVGTKFSRQTKLTVNTKTEFGRALESALQRDGFLMAPYGMPVRYNVDMLQDAQEPTAYVHLFLPDGIGQDGVGISHMYALDSMMRVPPAAGATVAQGISLESSPDRLFLGQSSEVVFTLKRDGRPVSGGYKPYFEAHPNFPNLKETARTLDKDGRITVKGLRPIKAGQSYLRLILDKDTFAEAGVMVVDKSITVADLASPVASTELTPVVTSTPTVPVVPAMAPVVQEPEWPIAPGLLRGQLANWSTRAGYQLVWKAGYDFDMESKSSFHGDFVGAVKRLFHRMHEQGNLLRATIYQDNRVLEVREE
jgi:hypothetical protein